MTEATPVAAQMAAAGGTAAAVQRQQKPTVSTEKRQLTWSQILKSLTAGGVAGAV